LDDSREKLRAWISSLSVDSLKRIIEVDFNDYEDYVIDMVKEELSKRKDDFEPADSDCCEEFIETEEGLAAIREHIALLSDEELIDLIQSKISEYRKSAIDIVKGEINKRNIDFRPHFGTLMDLIKNVEFESVEDSIEVKYTEQMSFIEKYKEVYTSLLQLKPSEGNVDYLNIEKEDYHWNVSGEDANTGERYGVEFYVWNEWLSFLVKDEQVYDIGKENYITICLMSLTQYGFTEEEIQKEFQRMETVNLSDNTIKESESKEEPIYEYRNITLDRTLERASNFKKEVIEKMEEKYESLQVRPWVRCWARAIDSTILGMLLGYTWLLLIPKVYALDRSYTRGYGFSLLNFLIWAFIEAYFLSKWGYTPGKWILNTKVQDANGGNLSYRKALKRVLLVLLYGEGLLIPIVSFITNIVSYNRLMDRGITKWDEKEGVTVSHEKIEGYKVFLAVLLLFVIPILVFIINRGMFFPLK